MKNGSPKGFNTEVRHMPKLYIKNMVCNRCKSAVRAAVEGIGIQPVSVELGEVELETEPAAGQLHALVAKLQEQGFELISDKRSTLIENTKKLIINLVHHGKEPLKTNLSDYLSAQLDQDYNSLSKLFSEVENTTIEQYVIAQKIEKIKELILYDELSLSEIADRLNYSSLAHMSNQFKKVTGLSPSYYKQLKMNKRKQIDTVR